MDHVRDGLGGFLRSVDSRLTCSNRIWDKIPGKPKDTGDSAEVTRLLAKKSQLALLAGRMSSHKQIEEKKVGSRFFEGLVEYLLITRETRTRRTFVSYIIRGFQRRTFKDDSRQINRDPASQKMVQCKTIICSTKSPTTITRNQSHNHRQLGRTYLGNNIISIPPQHPPSGRSGLASSRVGGISGKIVMGSRRPCLCTAV